MTEQFIRRFVGLLRKNDLIEEAEYENFVYVLLGDMESLIVISSILFLSIVIGRFIPTVSFLLCFFSLRERTGGYHLDSYLKCYIGTIFLYLIISFISSKIYESQEILLVFVMIAMVVILRLGSINHPNMDMEKEELRENKKMSRIIVITEVFVLLCLYWVGNAGMIVTYSGMAIVLCAGLLLLAKLTGQEVKKYERK